MVRKTPSSDDPKPLAVLPDQAAIEQPLGGALERLSVGLGFLGRVGVPVADAAHLAAFSQQRLLDAWRVVARRVADVLGGQRGAVPDNLVLQQFEDAVRDRQRVELVATL